MLVFERDGPAFHYLDEGDPLGRPFVFQHGLGGDVSQPAGVFSPPPGIRLHATDIARGRATDRPPDLGACLNVWAVGSHGLFIQPRGRQVFSKVRP